MPVETFTSTRPPLSISPPDPTQARRRVFRASGVNAAQAFAQAQAATDASTDEVVSANGELSALRYGAILRSRALVGLRGAGHSYDGFFYVKSVTHVINRTDYKQRFQLTREGVGAQMPVVIP